MRVAAQLQRAARRLPRPVKRRLKALYRAGRRAGVRVSRTRAGSAAFDGVLALRSVSRARKLADLVDSPAPIPLSSSAQWFRFPTVGARRYLATFETTEHLEPGSKAVLVQYRYISERGRVRRDADVGKAWSLKAGYHEFLPRVAHGRRNSFVILTPPGTRAVDIGLSTNTRAAVTIERATLGDLGARTMVPAYDLPVAAPRSPLRLAVIADTFTITALRFEAHVLALPAEGWASAFDDFGPDLLLVESAWNGNDSAWQYCVANVKGSDRRLADVVEHARRHGVPALFWNKEDPAHYDDFIAAARLCDFVATTDAEVIPRYVADLGHDRVFALPFCIQPDIHNPRQPADGRDERLPVAAFLGSWWASKFDARRDAQVALFEGSQEFGLEIFDRYLTFNDHERYRIPSEWLPFVHGTLSYEQALSAYRRYAVLLNVNTVTDSPTMFSRRALEASASGALVVSNPSVGTTNALGEHVIEVASAEACEAALGGLGADPAALGLAGHRAYRHTHHHHTWAQRLDDVAAHCGLPRRATTVPTISVVLATKRVEGADRILRYLAALDDPRLRIEPIVVTAFDPAELTAIEAIDRSGAIVVVERPGETLGDCLNRGAEMSSGRFIAKVDDDDIYGPRYFQDLLLAIDHSRADIVGKQCHYQYFESADRTVIRYPGAEHRFTQFVCGSTLLAKATVYERIRFPQQRVGEDTEFLRRATAAGLRTYSADRFSYVSQRRADLSSHTWRAEDHELLSSHMSTPFCSGLPRDHIDA